MPASSRRSSIFAGILFWSWLWGVPGMLLAIPMMMVIKVVCEHVEGLHPIGKMLGDWQYQERWQGFVGRQPRQFGSVRGDGANVGPWNLRRSTRCELLNEFVEEH